MTDLVEKDLVYRIVGCTFAVHNELGSGFREKTYEKALCLEFQENGIAYDKQLKFPVYYRNKLIDEYVPDLVVEKKVIVELKTVETILDEHRGQLLNYLRITGCKVGLIINFKHTKLHWERLVLEKSP